MTSLPAPQSPTGKPLPTKPFSDPLLASLRNAVGWAAGRPILMSGFTITPDQRRRLEAWMTTLKSRLRCDATDTRDKAVELAKLTTAFPMQGQDATSSELRIEGYFEALAGLPAWAVAEARARIIRGETMLDARFAPTPPQLADIVRMVVKPLECDLRDLADIARADIEFKEPTKPEHDRVMNGFEKLKFDLAKSSSPPSTEAAAA